MSERASGGEFEVRKERWLGDLAAFIIESGEHGWAAEAERVEVPQRPGFKELAYRRDEWEYRDSYAGYFMAPGSSVVYYRGRPAWYMTYGGPGQDSREIDRAKETYTFLRKALMEPETRFPVRGPMHFEEGRNLYMFNYEGTLAVGSWRENIFLEGRPAFEQRGDVGLIIDKDEDRQPVFPWDL